MTHLERIGTSTISSSALGATLRSEAINLYPELIEIQDEFRTAREPDSTGCSTQRVHVPSVGSELVDLETPDLRIEDPIEPDPERGVVLEFLDSVTPHVARLGRDDFD